MFSSYSMLEWIEPKKDGYYIVLEKGFTYDMGNTYDLTPDVAYWNGGRRCFGEDFNNTKYVYWNDLPEFEGVDFV